MKAAYKWHWHAVFGGFWSPQIVLVAERVGFEPTVQLPVLRFSRPALSSTQPSLREWNRGGAGAGLVFRPVANRNLAAKGCGIACKAAQDVKSSLTKSVYGGKGRIPMGSAPNQVVESRFQPAARWPWSAACRGMTNRRRANHLNSNAIILVDRTWAGRREPGPRC